MARQSTCTIDFVQIVYIRWKIYLFQQMENRPHKTIC